MRSPSHAGFADYGDYGLRGQAAEQPYAHADRRTGSRGAA